ncbi:MAG: TonB-dependent receptor plug domain-containing protein [Spirosomataceae bacterium]
MNRYAQFTLIFTLLIGISAFHLEDDWLNTLVAQFEKYHQIYPQEKAYLHLDRPYYSVGETIWFKAYLTDGSNHVADSVSRVLYVDLINKQESKVVLLKKIALSGGLGQGELLLGDSLQAGEYQVRAYTNWMRNFSDDFFFRCDIRVLRADKQTTNLPPNADDIDVQFMPEGGNLIADVEGRVAFKAVNALGKGTTITGAVINQANDTLTGFSSGHLGMGYFSFKPESGQQYRIEVRKPNGQFIKYPLPPVLTEGFALMVDNLSNKDNVRVIVRHNKSATQGEFAILAHTRGEIALTVKAPIAKRTVLFNIPRSSLKEGITHITLLDEKGKPVAERLVFLDKTPAIDLQITTNKTTYQPREKVELELIAKDADGKPLQGNFSLAVTDAGQVIDKEAYALNIRSYLLLTSDLKGIIEQPSYYFDKKNINTAPHLDVLMMTQGWRRFLWNDVLKESFEEPPFFIEQGITFSGKVLRPNKKAPGKIKLTYMLVQKDSSRSVLMGESTENGDYMAYGLDIRDTTNLLVQAVNERGNRNFVVSIDPFQPAKVTITKAPYNPLEFDANELAEYLKRTQEYLDIERKIRTSREKMLQEVVIKAKRDDPEKKDTRRMMYGTPSNTVKFDAMNTAGALTIFDVIQGRVPGVQVSGSGMDRSVQIRGAANFSGAIEPLFVLDGMTVDKSAIMTVSVNDVEAVDILKGPTAAIYGSRGGGGVIAVLTKRGGSSYDFSKDIVEGTLVTKIVGYSPEREFYAPKYDKPEADHVRPDFRATVWWVPMIETDKNGKAKVVFFNTDAQTSISIKVEGMTPLGKLGVATGRYKVE